VPVDMTPLSVQLSQIRPIELRQARRTTEEPLFNTSSSTITIWAMSSRWASI
jgi:hypothetical protein